MDLLTVHDSDVSADNPDEGDLFVGADGDLVELTEADDATSRAGAAAEGQAIEAGLRTWRGEWFLDLSAGVPCREEIVGVKGITATRVQQLLVAEINRRGTVRAITRIDVSVRGREGSVMFDATLIDGTTINGTAPIGPT